MSANKKTVYVNGMIFTSDDHNLYADAMAVDNGIITWVGKEIEMPADYSEKVDLKGKRVLPGFVDAHMHPIMLADYSKKISALPPNVNSLTDLAARIREVRDQQAAGEWIEGWGYDEGKLAEKRSPNRYDLDEGCSDAPVSIIRTCGHIRCVNSKALELAGITKDTPDPQGGKIDRDENGEPTGVLRENARNLVTPYMPDLTFDQTIEQLLDLGNLLSSQGVTSISDMGLLDSNDPYVYYMKAVDKGFKQKVSIYYMWDNFMGDDSFKITKEQFNKDQQIHSAGLKIIGDGSVSGRTAWMNTPYLGTADDYGISVCSDEVMETAIAFCKENRCQLSMHAMGGKTIDRIVDRAYIEDKWTDDDTPHLRLEHVTEPSDAAIAKTVEKGFGFATQPIFLYCEIESYLTNLGPERTKTTYPVKKMLDAGVNLCFSTDAPATSWAVPSDPFPCIKAAVTRKAYDGTDCGQDQKVDIETAIKLYTKSSAKVSGLKGVGELKPGYQADFIVLSEDILTVSPEEIDKVNVEETYISGEKIYERN